MTTLRRGRLRHPEARQREMAEKANGKPPTLPLRSWKLMFQRKDGETPTFRRLAHATLEEARARVQAMFDADEEDVYASAWIFEEP